ncbi:hypothetical protein ACFLEY_22655 [Bradyrhizobium sp. YCK136]|uniref:Uncharacterized protein n=2 Tax=Bradyrhizobium TaxID=374 RepID=A0ABV4F098_BRAEL|nr:hypothetical protein [Bradyrhizobium elkanii]BAR61983.1 hypothetical protein NK6_8839 [Bradyrhizobium diazoefficiens]MCP1757856.1 hypothetical protein [Bradyrhizobium elkanii]MCS3881847.1 hypothetical protein [Bradyrhizobium elkanii]MCS4218606.1 hypothetical protein [Bradyrhizobium elkanii]MCW2110094.1 hypothetical protein [Bradyrhizobium elkanii]
MTKPPSTTFSYRINHWSKDGWARVEYRHETLGSLVKQVFIPLNHSEEEQRGAVIMQFPWQSFHARYLEMLAQAAAPAPAAMEGQFTHRIDRPMEDPVGLPMETQKV